MRIGRMTAWTGVVLLAAAMLAGAGMYVLSTLSPQAYAPAVLDDALQTQVAQAFLTERVMDGFGNRVEEGSPFSWSIRDQACNDILASMDEIAFQLDGQGGRQKLVEQALRDQGISSPAVRFQDGRITLMVFSDSYNRVLSMDIGLSLDGRGRLHADVAGARVGRLPVPVSFVRDELAALREALPREAGPAEMATISPDDFAHVLGQVLGALDGETIDPVFVWPGNKRSVRVTGLRIAEGELTLQFTPL